VASIFSRSWNKCDKAMSVKKKQRIGAAIPSVADILIFLHQLDDKSWANYHCGQSGRKIRLKNTHIEYGG